MASTQAHEASQRAKDLYNDTYIKDLEFSEQIELIEYLDFHYTVEELPNLTDRELLSAIRKFKIEKSNLKTRPRRRVI